MKNILLSALGLCISLSLSAQQLISHTDTDYVIGLQDGRTMTVSFYGPDIVRVFCDPAGGEMRDPEATPPAKILVDDARQPVEVFRNEQSIWDGEGFEFFTNNILVHVSPNGKVHIHGGRALLHEYLAITLPLKSDGERSTVHIRGDKGASYYGGGIQNGRYDHTGKTIAIENQNSWTDGGVCSPAPWFWSTSGYGVLWNTFSKGSYSFDDDTITLTHETPRVDLFIMVDPKAAWQYVPARKPAVTAVEILKRYYQLTGQPVLLPKFGFYEGHLNAYNRDYWTEAPEGKGILFEDGKRYIESQTDNGGIRESLNGELPGGYQFSARAVIDRYEAADMPLGWILPNDGYACGYGQTGTLAGNVQNLRAFCDYARSKGVEIGLWTQSDLHPIDTLPALLQRDIIAEVRDAGVRVLKTDVAWVGRGYSFGLNGITDIAGVMTQYGDNARPFIITVDGWAGTQRYAGVWSGDQAGGNWEYIRFHIPTYIGAGLSGQPNITSDMDGIHGGGNEAVNIRDFQWKTFTPMQMNMDGWGLNEKYPQALGPRAADINRRYLKLKSELMPYTYSIAHKALTGLPMIWAMELYEPDAAKVFTTRYQYMYGPSILVAPVYQNTAADADGNDVRNGIYLPVGRWIDYFTGEVYEGGQVLCNFDAPLDKLPVFLREGAIVPMTTPHNNPSQMDNKLRIYDIFPRWVDTGSFKTKEEKKLLRWHLRRKNKYLALTSSFTEYDDDGKTTAYLDGAFTTTLIKCQPTLKDELRILIDPTEGHFDGFQPIKSTELRIRCAGMPKKVTAKIGGKKVQVTPVFADNVLILKLPETDITASGIEVNMKGFLHLGAENDDDCCVIRPEPPVFDTPEVGPTTIDLRWKPSEGASSYTILFDGIRYSHITGTHYLFEGLTPGKEYGFNLIADGGAESLPVFQAVTTSANPLEWAIPDILATCTAQDQPGQELPNLFNHDTERDLWHTVWGQPSTPLTIEMDLGAIYTLDHLEYFPRTDAGNGTITAASVSWSRDGSAWSDPVHVQWPATATVKAFSFDGNPQARFLRFHVSRAVGGFGSGRELLILRVPGTQGYKGGVFNEKGEAVESL